MSAREDKPPTLFCLLCSRVCDETVLESARLRKIGRITNAAEDASAGDGEGKGDDGTAAGGCDGDGEDAGR